MQKQDYEISWTTFTVTDCQNKKQQILTSLWLIQRLFHSLKNNLTQFGYFNFFLNDC